MTTFSMKAQTVQAWRVSEVLEAVNAGDFSDSGLDLISQYMDEGHLSVDEERKVVSIEVRGQMFDAPEDYWIVYNHGFFEAVTEKYFQEQFLPNFPETETDFTSFGADELKNRFGTHKATIEGPNASMPIHANLREVFLEVAIYLDNVLPHNRSKVVALERLEDASMWSHKTLANFDPLDEAGFTPVRKGE